MHPEKLEKMTPAVLRVLLDVYTKPDYERDSPALSALCAAGLVEVIPSSPGGPVTAHTTNKGDAWLKAILSVPEPRAVYVDQVGTILNNV